MDRFLRRVWLVVRRIVDAATAFSWWTTAGLRDRRTRPTGLRLLALGLVVGLLVGWANGTVVHVVTERELPKPVTPPPPGMAWARAMTTGYCPCWRCCGWNANGHTSIGRDVGVFPFGIAVDQGLLPYRLDLLVPGYGLATIDDTGGRMRQDARKGVLHLDLRFVTHAEAERWGVRWMWVAVPLGSGAAALER